MEPIPASVPSADGSPPTLPLPALPRASPRTVRCLELGLVLMAAFGSALYQSVATLIGDLHINPSGTHRWLLGMLHQATALGVCAYVLHKQGRSFRQIGLTVRWYDPFYGIGIMVLGLLATGGVTLALYRAGVYFPAARMAHASVVAQLIGTRFLWSMLSFTVLNAFFEELIVRAYLITDVRFLTGSTTLAVVVSAVFQGIYHLYQGWQTAVAVTAGFVVFSLFYVWLRRITPVVIAHLLWDLCMVGGYVYWQSHRPS